METTREHKASFTVVCVGLSAGGLAPIKEVLQRLDRATGMAYVVIPHLHRGRPSSFSEILGKWTAMPVEFAETRCAIHPNHVYVIPPDRDMTISDGHLVLQPRSKTRGFSNVITLFMMSLANSRLHPGIAIILSGIDADGAAAMKAVKENGGITIAQDTPSARFPDMPQAAIDTGFVDYVLPAEAIAEKLNEIASSASSEPEDTRPDSTTQSSRPPKLRLSRRAPE